MTTRRNAIKCMAAVALAGASVLSANGEAISDADKEVQRILSWMGIENGRLSITPEIEYISLYLPDSVMARLEGDISKLVVEITKVAPLNLVWDHANYMLVYYHVANSNKTICRFKYDREEA